MKKFRGLIALLAMACGSAALAADSPLSQISKDADVVIRVRQFDATVEKFAALANAVQPGTGDLVSQNSAAFGLVLSNPAMAGVDRTKDFYLFLFVRDQGEPKALFAIPTTDGEELTKALPSNFESQVREDWVFYADKDHGVPEATSAADSLAGLLEGDSPTAQVFDNSDISLHVNVAHITEVYAEKLQQGRAQFESQLENGLNAPGVTNPQAVVGVLKAELELAFKVLDETDSLTLGYSPSAEGLQINNQLVFTEGSDLAKFLGRQPKSKFAGLSKLAGDLPMYIAMSGDFAELGEIGMQLAGSMFEGTGMQEGMTGYIAAMKQAQAHTVVTGMDLGSGKNGLLRSSLLVETPKATELLVAGRALYEKMSEMKVGEVTTKISMAPDSETYGKRKCDVITTTQEVDASSPGAQMITKMNTILYGENGIQSRMAALSDGLLLSQGGGKESMEAALKAYDSGNNTLADVRKDLPEESHLLVLFDLPGLVYNGMLAATTLPDVPVPFQRAAVEELQITRSYGTVTAVGNEGSLNVQAQIPVSQFQGIMKLVTFLRSVH